MLENDFFYQESGIYSGRYCKNMTKETEKTVSLSYYCNIVPNILHFREKKTFSSSPPESRPMNSCKPVCVISRKIVTFGNYRYFVTTTDIVLVLSPLDTTWHETGARCSGLLSCTFCSIQSHRYSFTSRFIALRRRLAMP